ncbi:M50 family metallopeptidase [Demequina sp.]|uniref:M50 family metallopeptidase n=1 Tax=Demequina sp. TaxID=2050685 RepID=UPI003D122A7B
MLQVLGVVIFIVGLLVSIGLHEVGHMLPAKKFGVRVSEYFIGFGPTLWSRKGKETEYGFKAIPLGGYVKLVGMIPPEEAVRPVKVRGRLRQIIADAREASVEEVHEGEDYRAFYHLTWWRKVIVMFGGPFVNLVLAIIAFTIVQVGVGMPVTNTTVSEVAACVPASVDATCTAADPESPAALAGLQVGDTIVAINDTSVETWEDIAPELAAHPGEQVTLTVDRDGETLQLTPTLASVERGGKTVGYLGFYPSSEIVKQGPLSGVQTAWNYSGMILKTIATLPVQIYHATLATLGIEERTTSSVMGIVGVGRVSADIAAADVEGYTWQLKAADMLNVFAGLNLALFAFNMIPLVPLDGGHIASALWQGIKNGWARVRHLPKPRPVDVARMMPLAYGVFGLLIIMGAVLILADIFAPVQVG